LSWRSSFTTPANTIFGSGELKNIGAPTGNKLPKASDANAINSNLGLTSILRLRCSGCWRIINYQNAQNTNSFIVLTGPFVCLKLVPSSISLPIHAGAIKIDSRNEYWNLAAFSEVANGNTTVIKYWERKICGAGQNNQHSCRLNY